MPKEEDKKTYEMLVNPNLEVPSENIAPVGATCTRKDKTTFTGKGSYEIKPPVLKQMSAYTYISHSIEAKGDGFRTSFGITFRRNLGFWLWRFALPNFLIATLAFAVANINADEYYSRTDLLFTLILTLFASHSALDSALPKINYLTLLDKYSYVATFFLMIMVGEGVITSSMDTREEANDLDRYIMTVLGGIWTIFHIYWFFHIVKYNSKTRALVHVQKKMGGLKYLGQGPKVSRTSTRSWG